MESTDYSNIDFGQSLPIAVFQDIHVDPSVFAGGIITTYDPEGNVEPEEPEASVKSFPVL